MLASGNGLRGHSTVKTDTRSPPTCVVSYTNVMAIHEKNTKSNHGMPCRKVAKALAHPSTAADGRLPGDTQGRAASNPHCLPPKEKPSLC